VCMILAVLEIVVSVVAKGIMASGSGGNGTALWAL
jgi:hypothetical protein